MGVEVAVMAISAVASAAEGMSQAKGLKRMNKFNAEQNKFNQEMLELRKKDILAHSDVDVGRRQEQLSGMLGSQRAALAASGIEIDGMLGASFERDERQVASDDIDAIKNNAWNEAMGIQTKQMDMTMQQNMDTVKTNMQANQSLVTGGLGAVSGAMSAYSAYGKGK